MESKNIHGTICKRWSFCVKKPARRKRTTQSTCCWQCDTSKWMCSFSSISYINFTYQHSQNNCKVSVAPLLCVAYLCTYLNRIAQSHMGKWCIQIFRRISIVEQCVSSSVCSIFGLKIFVLHTGILLSFFDKLCTVKAVFAFEPSGKMR